MAVKGTLRRNRTSAPIPFQRRCHPAEVGRLCLAFAGLTLALTLAMPVSVHASTYVVYVALDDPVYDELDTLNGHGLLDDYQSEVRPIARVEVARLILEAEQNLDDAEEPDPLARSLLKSMREEFSEEVQWLENAHEDNPPTMLHPLERVEAQYIYSSGTRRTFNLSQNSREFQAREATPLLPNNDGIATSAGSNEVLRVTNWAGLAGFLSAYGEAAVAGPITRSPIEFQQSFTANGLYKGSPPVTQTSDANRLELLRGGVVASFGNQALSFGYQEMGWGVGHFASLSQGDNARPFAAVTFQSVHPRLLPWFLRYLGPFRHQIFIGRLDHGRYDEDFLNNPVALKNYSYPWISGQVIAFKPLPTFEFGFDHVIMFGGTNNSNYGWTGWIGRATGLNTGSTSQGNTNSRGGVFLKIYVPRLRNTQIYQEILGEDNLSTEFRPVGGILPFLSVSYQGGVYIPQVTRDGLTDARFEYAVIEPNYSRHDDSLYWAYKGNLMGDPMGPDSTEIDLSVGRWLDYRYKGTVDVFYTERAPVFQEPDVSKERSGGVAFDLLQIPTHMDLQNFSLLGTIKVRAACEYVHDINWMRQTNSVRTMVMVSGSLWPTWGSIVWH